MKFSIIIPCYNVSKYLEQCLNSVIKQSFKDWEIILINDGSTDNTEDIINLYLKKDSRIKCITQKNQGLSVARNEGVKEAKGDYILFLDSDDWYKNENCLDNISKTIANVNSDIVVFCYQRVTDNGHLCEEDYNLPCFASMKEPVYSGEQYLYYVLSHPTIYLWYPWRYAFNRSFWLNNQFSFRLPLFEDIDIIYSILLKAQKISILNVPIYQYRTVREGSLTQVSKKSLYNLICVSQNTINTVIEMDIDDYLKKLLENNFSYGYFTALTEVNFLKKSDKKEIFELLNKNRSLMNYATKRNKILIKKIISILGIHITSKLLFLRLKQKNKI